MPACKSTILATCLMAAIWIGDCRKLGAAPPQFDWGGRIKASGTVMRADEDSVYQTVGAGTFYDGSLDLRLIQETFFSDQWTFECHYEAVLSGGDRFSKQGQLRDLYSNTAAGALISASHENDDRRLMDLTAVLDEKEDRILYHRLDRLALTYQPDWGLMRIGRQALTWGNGMIFNPMDLFNPFSPTDIERDYKPGDDMFTAQIGLADMGGLQVLYVARRDTASGGIEAESGSLAAKLHFAAANAEFDIMAARHYEDNVIGIGAAGYLADAAWRMDLTGTFLDTDTDDARNPYVTWVANIDYSWVWFGRYVYGLLEFYYNGLGQGDYAAALADGAVVERLGRGELYVLGRQYLSGEIQIELHPLLMFHLTAINNIEDPSGILLPRAVWDAGGGWQMTGGARVYYGEPESEFGGFSLPAAGIQTKPSNSAFVWLTYFF